MLHNWLNNVARKLSAENSLALLSIFSFHSFAVVRVISQDGNYAEVEVLKIYDSTRMESILSHHSEGSIHKVHRANLYPTLESLSNRVLKTGYPDAIMSMVQMPHIVQFLRDYPQLKGNTNFFDQITYETYNIRGFNVLVLQFPKAVQRENEAKKQGYPHPFATYYWFIPDIGKRSIYANASDAPEGPDREVMMRIIGVNNGLYLTVEEAASAAEQYIDHFLYGSA